MFKQAEANSFVVNNVVALARGIHEAGAILNGHLPARIGDESRLLQDTCGDGNRTAVRS